MRRTVLAFAVILLAMRGTALTVPVLGCEGDSQAAVRGPISDPQTWCAQVAHAHGWNHTNFAAPGSTTADVIARLPHDLELCPECACFVVQIGANDSAVPVNTITAYPPEWTAPILPSSGISVAQFQANLTTIATTIRGAGIPLTFLTQWAFFSTPEVVQQQFYVDAMKDTAALLDPPVPVVDVFALQFGGVWWNYGNNKPAFWATYELDYQHPSAEGHAWEAAQLRKPRYRESCAFQAE